MSPSLCPPRGFPPALSAPTLFPGRRHTPYGNQTDYRIFELNKRLQNWTEVGSSRGGWPGAGGCSQLGPLGTGSLRQDGDRAHAESTLCCPSSQAVWGLGGIPLAAG